MQATPHAGRVSCSWYADGAADGAPHEGQTAGSHSHEDGRQRLRRKAGERPRQRFRAIEGRDDDRDQGWGLIRHFNDLPQDFVSMFTIRQAGNPDVKPVARISAA